MSDTKGKGRAIVPGPHGEANELPDSVRRVIGPDGAEWYVAMDVAPTIGFIDHSFFRSKFRPEEKSVASIQIGQSIQRVLIVSRLGVARLKAAGRAYVPHGESKTPLYRVWVAMRKRCRNPNDWSYSYYGARGIKVCPEWDKNFEAFRQWAVANGYEKGLSIDRRDVNGHYEPSNCRWATRDEQARNTRHNRPITAFGETKLLTDWPHDPRCVIKFDVLRSRLRKGWSPQEAMTTALGLKEKSVRIGRAMIAATPLPTPGPSESWRPVPGWLAYEVSDYGRIRSRWSRGHSGMQNQWQVLNPKPNATGHVGVSLYDGAGRKGFFLLSRLVLTVFVGPPPFPRAEACHFPDPNPANNCLSNLRWDSRSGNGLDVARVDAIARSLAESRS